MFPFEHLIYGALLHDLGKLPVRAGMSRQPAEGALSAFREAQLPPAVDACIRYHHPSLLQDADLPADHPAYVVSLAADMAAGGGSRHLEAAGDAACDAGAPIHAIFQLLHGGKPGDDAIRVQSIGAAPPDLGSEKFQQNTPQDYKGVWDAFIQAMQGIQWDGAGISRVLAAAEQHLTKVPYTTKRGDPRDISLFDHLKMTAAYASCLYQYLADQGETDYAKYLAPDEANGLFQAEAFAVASFDLSGIQAFIYGVIGAGAMKSMRARSFYLEMMAEHIADEVLGACGLTRANLLYAGGGHAYLLLPNTAAVRTALEEGFRQINRQLLDWYDTALYVAWGIQETSADTLIQGAGGQAAYRAVFASIARMISQQKMARYTAADVQQLNDTTAGDGTRECSACGRLDSQLNSDGQCTQCSAFAAISKDLLDENAIFTVETGDNKGNAIDRLRLPSFSGSAAWLAVRTEGEVAGLQKAGVPLRAYAKNNFHAGVRLHAKLWMGDVAARKTDENGYTQLVTMEEFAEKTKLNRVAVLRADVDGLGTAFVSGFGPHATLTRTAAFSREMSIFFRYYINHILRQQSFTLGENHPRKPNELTVVYAGGDDVFLVGAWDEVFCAATDLADAFRRYTGGGAADPLRRHWPVRGQLSHPLYGPGYGGAGGCGKIFRPGRPDEGRGGPFWDGV